ncbi:unnamed protein product [Notodromas monacha]|uniref:Origin recognition complex subunit 5 C-terminal domain-containing protein n=1 Tax=Notodromas monacha TaxID=399045 RepID=A0A7R9BRX8_9CRUS|nr:unnamed protein product [Notodromas monacha]CAG0919063.1 unnamed protein product [Notodromas monacha]
MESPTKPVSSSLPELDLLIGRSKHGTVPSSIFLYGPRSSGKSYYINQFFGSTGITHVRIQSQFCNFKKDFEELIIAKIMALMENEAFARPITDPKEKMLCMEFNPDLTRALNPFILTKRKLCLVFEDAESFVYLDKKDALSYLLSLQEITCRNVCVILVSKLPWEKFMTRKVASVPLSITVPPLTEDQVIGIVCQSVVLEGVDPKLLKALLRNVVKSVFSITRNVRQIVGIAKSVAGVCNGKLVKMCLERTNDDDDGEPTEEEVMKIWSFASPHIKKAVMDIHLRMLDTRSSAIQDAGVELPMLGKFLLIAAFIASYNSPKWDKIFFSKRHKENHRRTKFAADKKYAPDNGPQYFTRSRLLAIFKNIFETSNPEEDVVDVIGDSGLLPLIKSMERSNLIYRGSADLLLNPKYKCVASGRRVTEIAKQVGVNLFGYMKYVPDT